jgi:pyruvate/2-oxoglutarate dehydrogenase complex dihydrolipoamide acyltransferase (E2) component
MSNKKEITLNGQLTAVAAKTADMTSSLQNTINNMEYSGKKVLSNAAKDAAEEASIILNDAMSKIRTITNKLDRTSQSGGKPQAKGKTQGKKQIPAKKQQPANKQQPAKKQQPAAKKPVSKMQPVATKEEIV